MLTEIGPIFLKTTSPLVGAKTFGELKLLLADLFNGRGDPAFDVLAGQAVSWALNEINRKSRFTYGQMVIADKDLTLDQWSTSITSAQFGLGLHALQLVYTTAGAPDPADVGKVYKTLAHRAWLIQEGALAPVTNEGVPEAWYTRDLGTELVIYFDRRVSATAATNYKLRIITWQRIAEPAGDGYAIFGHKEFTNVVLAFAEPRLLFLRERERGQYDAGLKRAEFVLSEYATMEERLSGQSAKAFRIAFKRRG